ncbi:CABYR protein, partial [Eudromia elegans]|nr:CABYR protein [Eudromia elegans]
MAPYGLKTLLGGLSRAAFSANPNNIPGFAALYFQELLAFREEGWSERLPASLGAQDAPLLGEPKQKEKCTDTEEDQLLRGPDAECTSKMTQYPSTHDDVVGNKPAAAPDEASSPKGPELAYVPADPAQLATQMLGNADPVYSVKDVATSVQTLPDVSLSSENVLAAVAGAAEDEAAAAAVAAVRAQAGEPRPPAEAGAVGPSDSQAEVATNDANQVSSAPLQEEPSPPPPAPPPAPPPRVPLQALPPPDGAGLSVAAEALSVRRAEQLRRDAEVP